MDVEAAQQLQPYLRPGEKLLWCGRPDPSKHLTRGDIYLIPFGIFWLGFSIVWTALAFHGGYGLGRLFALFGTPFVAIGLYMVGGRFYYKAWRKRRTAYGVTTERALIAFGVNSLKESPVRNQPLAWSRSRDGGHVSVVIGRSPRPWWAREGEPNTGMELLDGDANAGFAFFDVADGDGLTRAIDQLR